MAAAWPSSTTTPASATRDTLHAHTQVLGKFAATLAPPEPQLQHAALRVTARGWETRASPGARRLRSARRRAGPACLRGRRRAQRRPQRRVPLTPDRAGRRGHARAARRRRRPRRPRDAQPRAAGDPLDDAARPGRRARVVRHSHGSTPTSPRPPAPRSCWPSCARPIAGARRRSTPGGGRSTSP